MDIYTSSGAYQGTFSAGTVEVPPVLSVSAVASINASNMLEITFWANKNGERVTTKKALLGAGSYLIRDKSGASIGISQSGLSPDLSGYYHTSAANSSSIVDLNHYVMEFIVYVEGSPVEGSVGLVIGE